MRKQAMILALDLGSTAFKAALFDSGLNRLAEQAAPTPYMRQEGLSVELDPEDVWSAAEGLIRKVAEKAGVRPSHIGTVAVASQAQTFCVMDAGGRPMTPFISWLDGRAAAEAAEIQARFGPVFHQHCSFPAASGQLQVCQIRRLLKLDGSLLAGRGAVAPLPCFVFHRLAAVRVTDSNLAAMSGLFSLERRDWWDDILDFCGIPREALPGWLEAGGGFEARSCCAALGVGRPLRLVSAGNDQTAGAYGAGCGACNVLVTLGTALVAYRVAGDRPGPYSATGCWGPYPGGRFYELAYRDEGCLALDFARRKTMPDAGASEFLEAAEREQPPVGDCGWLFIPGRIRSGDPWIGDGERRLLPYAAVEGITFSVRQLVFEDLQCRNPGRVLVAGGGAQSGFWRQLIADALNMPVERACGDSLLGAARMASGAEPDNVSNAAVATPNPERAALLAERFKQWAAAQKTR